MVVRDRQAVLFISIKQITRTGEFFVLQQLKHYLILSLLGGLGAMGGCSTDSGEDPGRVTIHRLNRAEYNNTVRDILHTELTPAQDFPLDDHGYGFDNIADVLSLSGLQLELYQRAATMLTDDLLRRPPTFTIQPEAIGAQTGSSYHGKWWSLWEGTPLTTNLEARDAGDFVFSIRTFGRSIGGSAPELRIDVDGQQVAQLTVSAPENAPEIVELALDLSAGSHALTLTLVNPSYDATAMEFRRVMVDWMRLEGPMAGLVPSQARDEIITCELDYDQYEACAENTLSQFAYRAFRRPVTTAELAGLMNLVRQAEEESDHPEVGLANAMQAILLSPHFIFRVELDEDPASLEPHALTDFELASRLSYFIWSSAPDDTLLALATEGTLNDDDTLVQQVTRMLDSAKSKALVENFAGQWLYTRAMKSVEPEPNTFPDFDDELAAGLKMETESFFQDFLANNTPVEELLSANFTYLNERVATHYGIEGIEGDHMRRVALGEGERGGLLTQGSLLTVTSYPARTSPVQRGKWVLQQLLCSEPNPPPPGVEGLTEEVDPTASLRERLEQHRAAPVCASCHEVMDPIGFALEHFNAVGQWRENDNGFAIDDTGVFPDGTSFEGAIEMSNTLQSDPNLQGCIAEHMFVYAMGRGMEQFDDFHVEKIVEHYSAAGGGFRDLVQEIVLSESFRKRRGDTAVDTSTGDGAEQ